MKFRLRYAGELKSAWLKDRAEKQRLRRVFHAQMRDLWDRILKSQNTSRTTTSNWNPLKEAASNGDVSVIQKVGKFTFAPFVSQTYGWNTVAKLEVLFLRASEPGQLINHGGDIDNRVKVLFDSLRMPQNESELPADDAPGIDETPFCVLLQDDALITGYSIDTDRLLAPPSPAHVELIINVEVKPTRVSMFTVGVF